MNPHAYHDYLFIICTLVYYTLRARKFWKKHLISKYEGGALSVMVISVGNIISNLSSNTGQGCLLFKLCCCL